MEYQYKSVTIYADSKDTLYIVPKGRPQSGIPTEIDGIIQLNAPYTDEELEEAIKVVEKRCFSIIPNDREEYTAIERFLKVKGYSKAVRNKRLVYYSWNVSQGYSVTPTERRPREGYNHLVDKTFNLGYQPQKGEIAKAIREAIKLSTI